MARNATPTTPVSEEDKSLFRKAMEEVKPLATTRVLTQTSPKVPPLQPPVERIFTPPRKETFFLSDHYVQTVQAESVLHFFVSGLPTKRRKALSHGHIRWEARLDLHGLYADGARDALLGFITQQVTRKTHCVLIIHGKGGSEGKPPVLKNLVNHWLPQLAAVLGFHSALPRDGGNGAVYVLLKQKPLF